MSCLISKRWKHWLGSEWTWLIPALAAGIICYLRFPVLQNDDHQPIIEYIARTGTWPYVLEYRSAQHMLYYHAISARLYQLLEWAEPVSHIPPVRAGQLLNLACMLGLMALLIPILRQLVSDFRARVLSLLIFSSSTRWITMSATIDNDTMMALFATGALMLTIRMMIRRKIPSWPLTLSIAFCIGLAGMIKHNGQQFLFPLVGCLLIRRWLYHNNLGKLLARSGIAVIIIIIMTIPFYLRHHRDTGSWIYHDQGFHLENWSGSRWEFFTFRFGEILRRPFIQYQDVTDERLCPADLSWPSKIYMNWWSLPNFLPDRPSPIPTMAIFITALPITIIFIIGLLCAVLSLKRNPVWFPALGWIGIIAFFVLAASYFFPEPRWGCHTYPRMWLGGAGGMLAVFALACEKLIHRWPTSRWLIYILVGLQLVAFWWLLLSGPFYSFYRPWPDYRM